MLQWPALKTLKIVSKIYTGLVIIIIIIITTLNLLKIHERIQTKFTMVNDINHNHPISIVLVNYLLTFLFFILELHGRMISVEKAKSESESSSRRQPSRLERRSSKDRKEDGKENEVKRVISF